MVTTACSDVPSGRPSSAWQPAAPGSAADLGDRLVLAPVEINSKLDDQAVRKLAKDFSLGDRDADGVMDARRVNVVVLVPSTAKANLWRPLADRVHYVKDLEKGVAELVAGHVGLVVLVNKYDGVDLPGTACELLVIDGIPRPLDAVERREASALHDSPTRRARDVQRIEQGMGRGVRDVNDHCAVLLMGAGLGLAVHDDTWLGLFSPATRAQLRLSRDVALQLQVAGLDGIRAALTFCLDRGPQWVQRSKFDSTRWARPPWLSAIRLTHCASGRSMCRGTSTKYSGGGSSPDSRSAKVGMGRAGAGARSRRSCRAR
ncbi:helicase C-terminal domain-containing protein [Alloactinosynnema sp. L-07]|uniref:helicase C-terminal domain-containing protein n=1 Tax=Alloactinosynnema sp. L-07 TaxID=1653480 RepID=UPI0018D3CCBB|nr:helicase C-terminal domain-containing protein [Alloactinosynnema sp. L-07]